MIIEAVCFDMDGTLIRNTDSVRYLCTLNGQEEELDAIERREAEGTLLWIDADYHKARLIEGLNVAEVDDRFDETVELIQDIHSVIGNLKSRGIRSLLVTAGPIQVARILGTRYGFDDVYGSQYEVDNGRYTGRITRHLGYAGKLSCLDEFCLKHGIALAHCVAVGDSESDIALFEKCARSIAINFTDAVCGRASEYIITDSLSGVIGIIESWLAE